MSGDGIGYVVAVVNQASGLAETVESEAICFDRAEAEQVAADWREHIAKTGRRERYIVCEIVPVEDLDEGPMS